MDEEDIDLTQTIFAEQPNAQKQSGYACLLRIYPPSLDEGVVRLPHSEFVIGRDPSAQLTIASQNISRQLYR